MKWFKINNKNFTANEISVQYTTDRGNTYINKSVSIYVAPKSCDVTIDMLITSSSEYDYINNIYDNQKINSKFEILTSDFKAWGCLIKSITINLNNSIRLEVMADHIESKDLSDRRDEIIDQILDKTSK